MKNKIIKRYIFNLLLIMLLFSSFFIMMLSVRFNDVERETIDQYVNALKSSYSSSTSLKDIYKDSQKMDKSILIVNDKGDILDSVGNDSNISKTSILEAIKKEGNFLNRLDRRENFKFLKAVKLKDSNYALVMQNENSHYFTLNNAEYYLILLLISLTTVSIISAYRLSKQISRPIEELTFATGRIAEGELDSRVSLVNNPDLSLLADNFNNLAERLEITVMDSAEIQSRLESILNSMNSGVIAIDKNSKILVFNNFSKALFGIYKPCIGEDISTLKLGIDLDELFEVANKSNEFEIVKDESKFLRYRASYLTNRNMDITGKVVVIQDITDLKKLESLRTQFVANVSHELKTPLTSIKGYAETLRDVSDKKTRDRFLDIIDIEAERLSRLIEDILSLSTIENSTVENTEIVNASEVVYDTCTFLEKLARDKNIEFTLTVKGKPVFLGDSDQFRQLVINLTENAIKYSDENGKVKVRLDSDEENMILSVSDNGIGISSEHLPRLFERFYRVSKSRDRAKGGTGLGLAIVKHIALAFNGSITVDSIPGKGSVFTLTVPLYQDKSYEENNEIKSYKLT